MENLIDLEHVGVAGHSFGGYTALAAGGAQIDWAGLMTLCADHSEADPMRVCSALIRHGTEMATMSGLTAVPEGLWPALGDPRVDAVVSMAGGAFLFGSTGMKALSVPLLALVGSEDYLLPPEWNSYAAYENAISAEKALVVFEGGDHMMFAQGCDSTPWVFDFGLFTICSDPVWDMDRAHDLINHFTTAFLLAVLKGDTKAASALTPEVVQFSGIMYETSGF
jgi:predicted dienelactone hydrolase